MAYLLDIETSVPRYENDKVGFMNFYSKALAASGLQDISKKMSFLMDKTRIEKRYSCIPDFGNDERELFQDNNYSPSVDRRMAVYKEKIVPLVSDVVASILKNNQLDSSKITHLITVSCTGLYAPGLEFAVADKYHLHHAEKLAVNFLGCYAGIKALKHAYYIANAQPDARVLVVSAELCTLHFNPSIVDEDVIASLLFSDGAASALVCGDNHKKTETKPVLSIDAIGSACIPSTSHLMTWDLSSHAFKMFLSRDLVKVIGENIAPVVHDFLSGNKEKVDYWAIHPGGIRIIEEVKERLSLVDEQVQDSTNVLKRYGNMSSPTILFILKGMLNRIKSSEQKEDSQAFACAFGPGLTVEMIRFSTSHT